MKKIVIGLASVMTLGMMLVGCGQKTNNGEGEDTSWHQVEKDKKLIVATSGTLFPVSYYNDKNELTGYSVEVSRGVAKRLGLEIEFKEYNVDGTIASLKNGTVNLIANDFSLSEERAKNFSLSLPLKYSFDSLIVRQSDDSGISALEDLKGKKAAGEATTGYMKIAEKFGAELISYDNATNDQYLTDVANGRTDVILNDYYLQKMSLQALPDIPVKILAGVYFNASNSGLLYNKVDVALREKIDEVIQEMQKDGELTTLAMRFFGEDVSVEPTEKIDRTVSVD